MKKVMTMLGLVAVILATGCVSTALPPMDTPLRIPFPSENPPLPPFVSWTCVIAPLTSSCAGVMRPVLGAFLPPAVRPEAARSCSCIAAPRMSASPSTMNFPLWTSWSVRIVPHASPSSHWPRQLALFSNLLTMME